MAHDAVEVTNLLYRYAELMDNGDLEGVAKLFAHARIKMGRSEELLSSEQVLEVWRRTVRLYPCGTPRIKHLITNPIVEIDEVAGTARCRRRTTFRCKPLLQVAITTSSSGRTATVDSSIGTIRIFDAQGDLSRHLRSSAINTSV